MALFKRVLDLYIDASIHVALSASALALMTRHMFGLEGYSGVPPFVFFGTIVGYNFVKYDALARTGQLPLKKHLKAIIAISAVAFIAVAFCFFKLRLVTQITSVAVLALTTLYTLPFFPNHKNARNWKGVKIYIVALCWVGATVVLPVIDDQIPITFLFWLKCAQRFILIFTLVLVFEIIDLRTDDPNLKTVPQQIGVKRTKITGWLLLLVLYGLEFLNPLCNGPQLLINAILIVTLALFLLFANENRPKYYTSFWAESIPIFWWLLLLIN